MAVPNWKQLEISELEKFIGFVLLLGVFQAKNEDVTQIWSISEGRPFVRKIMSRNRFTTILRVMRFDDAFARHSRL
jgi:Transposase IS4